MSNPLLPKELISLLMEYESVVRANIENLRVVIIACSQEMADKYPDVETFEKATID